ncbi:MAG: chromosomal replication initiator protein DnaA [Verrucomicrobiaceae bacterium]|nr:chromosomal replication initiator protein DnaA [Verrucomicrobiaceae bacterium]
MSSWSQICDIIRPRIGPEFERWFGGLTASANDNGELVIEVPNAIHQLWIESNYASILAEAVTSVMGGARSISYSLQVGRAKVSVDGESELALSYRRHGGLVIDKPSSRVLTEPVRTPESLAEAGLSPKFSFENFVVGTTNSYCAAVAKAVAEKPGRIYNPLFFYSAPGLGKTHLLHAIGREIMYRKKRAVVRYVTSEMFCNDFVDAIRKQTLSQFRAKYRKVDVLLIDDVQFFAGKDSTQEEFFHTFNDLFNNTKQIVLASDKAPAEIDNLESRLVSRFEWGLTTQIISPDFETRVAILRRKMADAGVVIEPWILDFIAQRVRTDVRKLEGCLVRVAAHVSLAESTLTEAEVENMLRDVLDQEPGRAVNIDRIQRFVAERYDIRMSELLGRGRPKVIAEARQVAMYLTRDMAKLSLVDVGKAFGGRDHGTVIHACKVVIARMEQTDEFRAMISDLRAKILAP